MDGGFASRNVQFVLHPMLHGLPKATKSIASVIKLKIESNSNSLLPNARENGNFPSGYLAFSQG